MDGAMALRSDADTIIQDVLEDVLPDKAVRQVLERTHFQEGKIILISVGKAGWQMAKTASDMLGERITQGIVITKYKHSKGELPGIQVMEAAHPVPDENSFKATQEALRLVQNLTAEDTVLFLLSGGGSSLFEKPLVEKKTIEFITQQLLNCGADIVEINTIRKRLSGVKGGRFALACEPAKICNIILSDIIGDPLDMIASGPTAEDKTTCEQAMEVVKKYSLQITDEVKTHLQEETPKILNNIETYVTGSVKCLCEAAVKSCEKLGYETAILTTSLTCEAKEAGSFLASIARENQSTNKSLAFIAGGETVVQVTGTGKGGRNQELAISAAAGISGLQNTIIFSIGSDGSDGPTDAAGGFVDGETQNKLKEKGILISDVLQNNDAYHALQASGGLIITGATGTNVNDVAVILIKR